MNCITCHISFRDFEQAKKSVDSECSVSSRRQKYQRYPKNASILVKGILEGKHLPVFPVQQILRHVANFRHEGAISVSLLVQLKLGK